MTWGRFLLVAFSGHSGAGKTSLSKAIAAALSWKYASFGDYVRARAKDDQRPLTTTALQELGEALVKSDRESFCRAVLRAGDWRRGDSIVVDGVRHLEVLETLKTIASHDSVLLVLVEADPNTRLERLRERGSITRNQVQSQDQHSTAREIDSSLPQVADLVLDGRRPLRDLVETTLSWLCGFSSSLS